MSLFIQANTQKKNERIRFSGLPRIFGISPVAIENSRRAIRKNGFLNSREFAIANEGCDIESSVPFWIYLEPVVQVVNKSECTRIKMLSPDL